MQSLIPIINELQNIFKKTGTENNINLPQIVVVGSQSCGKSSVLESLVGKSFLPRGTGIVTRCPIILQLMPAENEIVCDLDFDSPEEDGEIREWCSFPLSDNPGKKYENFDDVRKEIEIQTDKMAGDNKGICMDPITVKVFSKVIPLTVVDLPGVVKNPVGDQPADIEQQVLDLIKKYIDNPNAIILAVSPADADIATSESIKIAKQVDPEGHRTLAVITKLDRMDRGTNAAKVLSGEIIQVKLGIIGVVNRSQQDIDNNKTIENAIQNEEDFLAENYPQSIGEIGSRYLGRRLNELLMKHIKDSLPDLIKRVGDLTDTYERKKKDLGPKIADEAAERLWVMMGVVKDFDETFKIAIKERSHNSSDSNILFPYQITKAFDEFNCALKKQDSELNKLDARISLEIPKTVNIEQFTSIEVVFKKLVKEQILLLEKPSTDCASAVHGILNVAVEHCLKDKRLEKLNTEICLVTRKLLASQLKEVKKSIKEYMDIQTRMIFSTDAEFLSLLKVSESTENHEYNFAAKALTEKRLNTFSSFPMGSIIDARNNDQCRYVKQLITTYFNVMRRQVADYIPKHVMYGLFDCTVEKLIAAVKEAVAGKEMKLVSEPENVIRRRLETEEMLKNLYQATEIIGGIQSNHN